MPKNIYEITYTVITDNDGLVSHNLKQIKEITNIEEEEDEDNNT